jgi:hypothetical protein
VSGVVIDADNTSALAGALKTFDDLVNVDVGFAHPVAGFTSFREPFDAEAAATARPVAAAVPGAHRAETGGLPFSTLMLGSGADDTDSVAIFRALFDFDDAKQDVLKGFFARPVLGATAFAAQGESVLRSVIADANSADQVVVTGSFIGGTGAGVLPSLVRQLSDKGISSKLHGIFLLEWLQALNGEGQVRAADMQDNARHGLEYFYKHMKERMKSSALIGPPAAATNQGLAQATPGANGAESLSIFPILAAHALLGFVKDAVATKAGLVHAYAIEENNPKSVLSAPWEGGKSLKTRLDAAQRAAAALRFYTANPKEIEALKDSFGLLASRKVVPDGLYFGIKAHADHANEKVDRMVELVLAVAEHHVKALEHVVSRFAQVFQSMGGLGVDETHRQFMAERPTVHESLKKIWGESQRASLQAVDQSLEKGRGSEAHARSLANKLVKVLLDSLTD